MNAEERRTMSETKEKLGRDFFAADDETAGIPWDNFVTALQVWSFMRPGSQRVLVRQAADEFGVAENVIRAAVDEHYWMFLGGPEDEPAKQYIDHEGE